MTPTSCPKSEGKIGFPSNPPKKRVPFASPKTKKNGAPRSHPSPAGLHPESPAAGRWDGAVLCWANTWVCAAFLATGARAWEGGNKPYKCLQAIPQVVLGPPEERLEEGYQPLSVVYFSKRSLPQKRNGQSWHLAGGPGVSFKWTGFRTRILQLLLLARLQFAECLKFGVETRKTETHCQAPY